VPNHGFAIKNISGEMVNEFHEYNTFAINWKFAEMRFLAQRIVFEEFIATGSQNRNEISFYRERAT